MATNSTRDVQLVIRARDEAAAAIDSVAKALSTLAGVQEQVAKGSQATGGTLGAMGDVVSKLNGLLKGQSVQSATEVAKAYEKISAQADRTAKALANQRQELAKDADGYAAVQQQITAAEEAIVSIAIKMRSGAEGALAGRLKAAQQAYVGLTKEGTRYQVSLSAQEVKIEQTAAVLKTFESAATAAQGALRDLQRAPAAAATPRASAPSQQTSGPSQQTSGPAGTATAAYRAQLQAVQDSKVAYEQARAAATALGAEMAQTEAPTLGLQVAFTGSKLAAEQARIQYLAQADALAKLKGATASSFADIDRLAVSMREEAKAADAARASNLAAAQASLSGSPKGPAAVAAPGSPVASAGPAASATAAYRAQVQAVQDAKVGYDQARAAASALGAELAAAANPSAALVASFNAAREASLKSEQGYIAQVRALNSLKTATASGFAEIDRIAVSMGAEAAAARDAAAAEAAFAAQQQAATAAAAAARANLTSLQRLGAGYMTFRAQLLGTTAPLTQVTSGVNAAGAAANNASKSRGPFLGLKPYELQNLSYQINDVFTQLASGTSLTQTIAQQGGQIFQLFQKQLTPILGTLAKWAPEIAVVGAAFVVLGFVIARAFEQQSLLREFNAQLAASADGATYNAKALLGNVTAIEQFSVSTKDAIAAVQAFIKDGIDPAQLVKFGKAANDLALVTGKSVPDAAKELGAAFSHGYDAVKKLDDEYDFLSAAEREHIRLMFESGQASDARSLAFQRFFDKMDDGAQKSRGPWQQAIKDLGRGWADFINLIADSRLFDVIGQKLHGYAVDVDYIINRLRGFNDQQASQRALGIPDKPLVGGTSGSPAGGPRSLSNADVIAIVKTAMLEASLGGASGEQDVASVVLNRMARSGQSASDVVTAPNQFEGVGNVGSAARARYDAISSDSQVFKKALENILPVLQGLSPDATKGATNFFAPAAQAALGRDVPKFADPNKLTLDRGGQQFFTGAFPGDKGLSTAPGGTTALTQASLKAGNDYIAMLKEQFAVTDDLTNAERIRKAGLDAIKKAEAAGVVDPSQLATARELAEADARRKVSIEQQAKARQLEGELAASNLTAAKAGNQSLQSILDGIDRQARSTQATVAQARKEGVTAVDGQSLDAYQAQIAANAEILKQQATQKFYSDALVALDKQRADAADAIAAKVKAGTLTPGEGAKQLQDVTAKLIPQYNDLAAKAQAFKESFGSAKLSPETQAAIDKLTTGGGDALSASVQAELKLYQDGIAQLTTARDKAIKDIKDQVAAGADAVTSLTAAKSVQNTFNPQIADLATQGKQFAAAVAGATPSPQLMAAISQFSQAANTAGRPSATNDVTSQVGQSALAQNEQQLNAAIAQRNELVQTNNALQQQGVITAEQLQEKNKAAYATTTPLIADQVAKMQALLDALHQQGSITDTVYDTWAAKLQLVGTQMSYVDQQANKVKTALANDFVNDATNAFNNFASSIANGTEVFHAARDAFLQFASDFLKQIADMILKQALFSALGMGADGSGATTSTFIAAIASQLHDGGTVGQGGARRVVSPSWFANAPRYHGGGIPGLKSDEYAAVLQRNEEVLAADSPRNVLNGGGGSPGGAAPGSASSVKVVNVFDPAEAMKQALGTRAGEKVFLNWVQQNGTAFKAAIG